MAKKVARTGAAEASIQHEKVRCLECGASLQLLSHRHLTVHGLTPHAYKRKYGLSLTQPLYARMLVQRRYALAQARQARP